MHKVGQLLLCCLIFALGGCERDAQKTTAASAGIPAGVWRATLQTEGGELPFTLELNAHGGVWQAYYINGEERVRVEHASVTDGRLTLVMPTLDSRLSATLQSDGTLAGALTLLVTRQSATLPFRAVHGKQHRFFAMFTPPEINVEGRWAMTFTDAQGREHDYVGEFRQAGSQVEGTVLRPSGDMRYLAGAVRGREFYLSTFDGSDARLFKAVMDENGVLRGDYWANGTVHMRWTARRDPDAALPDADEMARLKDDDAHFDFTFPDLDGEPVSLSDPRFAGKVVIVTLGGSWCINCHDEAEFLVPWYRENRDRGVEVVQVMFERVASREQAVEMVREFRAKFDLPYPVLLAGWGDTGIQDKFPELEGAFAYPTTLFIDREGRVRLLHVGFTGPGTGEHYQKLIADFDATVDALLEEGGNANTVNKKGRD